MNRKREQPEPIRRWSAVTLGDVLALEYGKSFPEQKRKPGPYGVYGSNGLVDRAHEYLLEERTIVVGRKGSAGEINYAEPKSWPIDTTYYVRIRDARVHSLDFVYYLLKWLDPRRFVDTTTKPGLNRDRVYEQVVPLPPLPVQDRIVQILQKADEIRRKQREALELADKTLPALFLEMFGDPATNPKGWPTVPLGECASIRRGLSKRPSPKGNVPIVRIKNLTLSGLDLSWSEMIEASPREIERGRLLPGDIVFSPLNGSIEHLAKSDVFAAPENETWVLDSNLCAFRANESVVRKGFLAAFLRLPSTLDLLRGRLAVRTSGGQWLLKTSTLQKVAVPVPPLQQQDYFIQQAEHYSETRKKYALAFREAELCFTSLMSQAFTGELTAEWEAANAEWIAAQKALHERLPRLLVLALLMEKAKRARRAATEVLVTALMKYAFLVQMEGNAARRRLYHFVPYHYGPFAKELYADLQALQDEGLVRVESDPDEDKTRIVLIDPAKAQEALGELPDDLKEDAATIIDTYGDLDHNALLRVVYEKYPAYARKSRLKRKGRSSK